MTSEIEAAAAEIADKMQEKMETKDAFKALYNAVRVAEEHGVNCDGALDALYAEIELLRAALQRAVDKYGKPGGPWNVPSEPGSWIFEANTALNTARNAWRCAEKGRNDERLKQYREAVRQQLEMEMNDE